MGRETPVKPETLNQVRRFVQTYVRKGPYTLYPNEEVVEGVILGLAENLEQHGKMYCPCAPVEPHARAQRGIGREREPAESRAKGHEMVCPCTPHAADIARQGYCDCALFASHEFVEQEEKKKGEGT